MFSSIRRSLSPYHLSTFSSFTVKQNIRFAHHIPLRSSIMQIERSKAIGPKNKKQKSAKAIERQNKFNGFDEVLQPDINQLLQVNKKSKDTAHNDETDDAASTTSTPAALPDRFTEIELTISTLSSTGDGLALSENADHVYVVPFTVPGDKVLAKVAKHFLPLSYTVTDLVKVIEPGELRDDSSIRCGYFAQCSGCQLQMMRYEDQLKHKKRIVEKAYANFSGLVPELIPAVKETFPSPKQHGYRTKLTPHFQAPKKKGQEASKEVPPIGYTFKNRRLEMDIEDCPIGTDIVRQGLKTQRKFVRDNIDKYPKGATLLLRESTTRIPRGQDETVPDSSKSQSEPSAAAVDSGNVLRIERDNYIEEKRCVTDHNATSHEYVDDYFLSSKAGDFFQNNNSILPGVTEYIRQNAIPKDNEQNSTPIKYLLDAYSGSGLFTITLSPLFKSSLGVDTSSHGISFARQNARANKLYNTGFAAADAALLFQGVPYPPDETLLVIDPPRKGCSENFLQQLFSFAPRRIVYVSCNVHTQARDVGVLVQGDSASKVRYDIESIRGFDFFPQTGHVEGVAILEKAPVQ